MGDQIYRHGLNKGGLEDILANQRLIATEARGIRGGASGVRAMNGPFHTPYKGDTVGIEFTTSVKGIPQRFGGMEGTDWPMEEGKYLQIHVTRVLYPGGRIVTYPPKPVAAPLTLPPKVGQVKQVRVNPGGKPSVSQGGIRPSGGGIRSSGRGFGPVVGLFSGLLAGAAILGEMALKQWLTENILDTKWAAERRVMLLNAIEASRFWFNHLVAARVWDIRQAKARGEEVTLHLVVDSQWIETDYGPAQMKVWVSEYSLLFKGDAPVDFPMFKEVFLVPKIRRPYLRRQFIDIPL